MLRIIRCIVLLLFGFVAAGCTQTDTSKHEKTGSGGTAGAVKDAPRTDQEAIQGTWVVASAEENGVPIVGAKGGKHIFSSEEMTIFSTKGEQMAKATYKLDPAKSPKEILMCVKVETNAFGTVNTYAKGIYQLDGDALKICWKGGGAEGPAPKEFTTEVGSGRKLTVYNRVKP
jgi:uncharacterized protein (TIGR03067 family)